MGHIEKILEQMPRWREQRLPPPRVSQSEVNYFRDFCASKIDRKSSMIKLA